MRINRALTEAIRMERFEEIYDDFQEFRLSCEDAAMMLARYNAQCSMGPRALWRT
jgi:hypothetical protein